MQQAFELASQHAEKRAAHNKQIYDRGLYSSQLTEAILCKRQYTVAKCGYYSLGARGAYHALPSGTSQIGIFGYLRD